MRIYLLHTEVDQLASLKADQKSRANTFELPSLSMADADEILARTGYQELALA
jgi:hypothetical protein